jgi:hypothetical protein
MTVSIMKMTDVDEQIESSRRVDEQTATRRLLMRRAGVTLLAAVPVIALFNLLGQRATTTSRSTPAVTVAVHAPSRVRAGLLFQAKITIVAQRTLPKVTLNLGNGWIDGITMNTDEPGGTTETSTADGGLSLSLGTIQADQPFVQYFEFQVNPTSWGSRSQPLSVSSNNVQLVRIDHSMTVIP